MPLGGEEGWDKPVHVCSLLTCLPADSNTALVPLMYAKPNTAKYHLLVLSSRMAALSKPHGPVLGCTRCHFKRRAQDSAHACVYMN